MTDVANKEVRDKPTGATGDEALGSKGSTVYRLQCTASVKQGRFKQSSAVKHCTKGCAGIFCV